MTIQQRHELVRYWVPLVMFICLMVAYVWSSATRFQMIDSRSTDNKSDIQELKKDNNEKFNRINDKLDVLIRRDR